MILNIKSSLDVIGNPPSILLSYTLKDTPAKLTVDGRSNLIAVVRRRLSDQSESSRRRKTSIEEVSVNFPRKIIETDVLFVSSKKFICLTFSDIQTTLIE